MCTNKTELRQYAKQIRREVVSKEFKNHLICEKILSVIERLNIESVFIYVSMGDEVSTHDLITELLKSGKHVCVPFTKDGVMSIITLDSLPENLTVDKHGNINNAEKLKKADFECDCAVVPLLAFDEKLYRLGYGRGYYDKFLENFTGVKIGIAYDEQLVKSVFAESHDVALDIIITPNGRFCGGLPKERICEL